MSVILLGLPPIAAGETDKNDPLHRAAGLSDLNLQRIRHSRPGGHGENWPINLRCNCHKKDSGQSYRFSIWTNDLGTDRSYHYNTIL